jgi:hypothetical protein
MPQELGNSPNTFINAHGRGFFDRSFIARLSGSYLFPYGIQVSSVVRYEDGRPLYRSLTITETVDGTALNQGPVFIVTDPYGYNRLPRVFLLDARIQKNFDFGRYGQFEITADLFNVTNVNTVIERFNNGLNYDVPTNIIAPRAFRVGLRYRF